MDKIQDPAASETARITDIPAVAAATACSAGLDAAEALAAKWKRQAAAIREQKQFFADNGYSSSLVQLWDTVAGVLDDCGTELMESLPNGKDLAVTTSKPNSADGK